MDVLNVLSKHVPTLGAILAGPIAALFPNQQVLQLIIHAILEGHPLEELEKGLPDNLKEKLQSIEDSINSAMHEANLTIAQVNNLVATLLKIVRCIK